MTATEHKQVVDGLVLHVDGLPPIARRSPAWCSCGKRDLAAHGGHTCVEVAELRAQVEHGRLPLRRRLLRRVPRGWRA